MSDAPGRKRRKLNPRQLAIVAAYTTPGPTMGKPTATAQAVLPHMSKIVGKNTVCRTLRYPEVREAVQEAVEQYGAGIGWRIKTLRDIASPETVLIEQTETTNAMGDKTVTVRRKPPNMGDAVRAVDVLNRMQGIYDEQHAAAIVSARFQSLAGRFHTLMANATPIEQENVPHENTERKPAKHYRRTARYMVGMLPCRVLPKRLYHQLPPNARSGPTSDASMVRYGSTT